MLLDIMTAMKPPVPEVKATARAWLAHGSSIPDQMDDGVSYQEMMTPYQMLRLHAELVDKPVGMIRDKAEDVLAWIADEEEFEAWRDLPEDRGEIESGLSTESGF